MTPDERGGIEGLLILLDGMYELLFDRVDYLNDPSRKNTREEAEDLAFLNQVKLVLDADKQSKIDELERKIYRDTLVENKRHVQNSR